MDLLRLREEIELLTVRLNRIRAERAAGYSPSSTRPELFRSAFWMDWDALTLVREALAGSEGRRAMRLGHLEVHLVELLSERAAAESLDSIDRALRERLVLDPGQSGALLVLADRSAREADRDKRARAESRVAAGYEALQPLFARAWDQRQEVRQKAGVVAADVSDARAFLSASEAMYQDVFDWWLRRTTGQRPFPKGAERHDVLHAMALTAFNGLFPKGDARPVLDRLADAGFVADFRLDGTLRDDKAPRPAAFPIDAPSDVVASYRGEGGIQGVRDCLYAWGEGLHFASIDPERPFEDRSLGEHSLPRAIGLLFQNVVLDQKWLGRAVEEIPSDLPRLFALIELFRIRRAAISAIVVRGFADESISLSSLERAAEQFSSTLGGRWPAALVLDECYAESSVDAAAFESVLFPALREQFDEDWWANPRAVVFLKKIFAQGQLESPAQLCQSLGLPAPSLLAALPRLQGLLG